MKSLMNFSKNLTRGIEMRQLYYAVVYLLMIVGAAVVMDRVAASGLSTQSFLKSHWIEESNHDCSD